MSEEKFRLLIRKYISNKCSADEVRLWFELIREGKYDRIFKEEMERVEWAPDKEFTIVDIPAFEHVYRRIKDSQKQSKKVNYLMVSRIAAVFIGFLIAFIFVFNQASKEQYKIVQAPFGETKEIYLPDHSVVTLNANSKIKYSGRKNNHKPREVWIEGEAYFSVTKNNQKFIVHARNLDVEVLGTEFNVNDRRNSTKVVLEEGKVKLNLSQLDESILMEPGELVEYSRADKGVVQKLVDTKKFTSWKKNLFVFDYTPLWEIAQVMEDVHGIKIEFRNETDKHNLFTGTYDLQEPHVVIAALETAFDFETKMTKDLIIFD